MRKSRRNKQRVRIRIPVADKPNQTILTAKDKEEELERHKTTAQYLHEYLEETEDEDEE